MATAQSLIDDVRSRVVEPVASYFTDAEILRWLNQGYKRFVAQTEWTERCSAQRVIANQFQYSLPTNIIKVCDVRWTDQYKVWFRDLEEFGRYVGQSGANTAARPYMYRIFPWDGTIRIYPKPVANSASTALSGYSGISSADTTIAVTSTTSFPSYGRITIENEQILYYATTATSFLQCVRGDGATTAVSHSGGVTVYHAPLEIYNVYQPSDLATSPAVGTALGPSYDEALISYACHVAMLKRERYDEAQMFLSMYEKITKTAIEERRRVQLDRLHTIKDEDEYGSYYSWV